MSLLLGKGHHYGFWPTDGDLLSQTQAVCEEEGKVRSG